jgi:hypothetical protein
MGKLSKVLTVSMLCFSLIITTFGVSQKASAQNDELVPPLQISLQQDKNEVNKHLIKMGFNQAEIATIPFEMKQDIASNGGVKKEVIHTESEVVKTDEFGNQNTLNTLYQDNDFSLTGYALKTASNTKENEYDIYVNYNWKSEPFFFWTDVVAISWQSQGSPISGTSNSRHTVVNWIANKWTTTHVNNNLNSSSNLNGTAWDVDIIATWERKGSQYGYGKQTIRVPKSYEGTTGAFQVGYSHTHTPGNISVSIGPVGIDFGGAAFHHVGFTLAFSVSRE